MDSKKLAKLIKVIVEAEVAKKHEHFLSKTFPKILEEEVNRRVKTLLEAKGGVVASSALVIEDEDPFAKAEALLQQERQQPKKQFTKNPALNEVLNQTQPFSAEQRSSTPQTKSILDQFQSVNEGMDKTVSFGTQGAQVGVDGLRASMASQMGYGDMGGVTHTTRSGLGVQTGVSHLDKALNRDYSQLVKRFKK